MKNITVILIITKMSRVSRTFKNYLLQGNMKQIVVVALSLFTLSFTSCDNSASN